MINTTVIKKEDIPYIHNCTYHAIEMDAGGMLLVTTEPSFIPLNEMDSLDSRYAVCVSISGQSRDERKYIFFAKEDQVDVTEPGLFSLKSEFRSQVLDLINKTDPKRMIWEIEDEPTEEYVKFTPVHPAKGNMYSDAGIILFRVESLFDSDDSVLGE